MAEKDSVFWDAIMEKNRSRMSMKKMKKYAKGIDSENLARQFSITKKEVEDIFAVFLRIDNDRSGAITAPEIAQGLSSFGCDVSPKVVQAVMRASDKNGDGEINFEEFLAAIVSKAKLKKYKSYMDGVMQKLAQHSEDYITAEILQDAWSSTIGSRITAHEANALLALAEGSDGYTTREQFSRMWHNT